MTIVNEVTGFTAERMLEIENNTIVDGDIVGDHLILKTKQGMSIDAGVVRGPAGPAGPNSLGFFLAETYGAVGNGTTDDRAAIQAAYDAAAANGGGTVYLQSKTYKINSSLSFNSSFVRVVGTGWRSQIKYDGTGTAIVLGSKSGPALSGCGLEHLQLVTSASPAIGMHLIGVQQSSFDNLRVSGAFGVQVKFDTSSSGPGYPACISNTWRGGYLSGGVIGLQLTKDPADTGTDGCNFNNFSGLRVASFSNIGVDIDAGEANTFLGLDSSTTQNGTIGVRINDDVNTLLGVRTDCSYGEGNTSIGIRVTANGRNHIVLQHTGNGISKWRVLEDPTVKGVWLSGGDSYNQITGTLSRGTSRSANYADTIQLKNAGSSTIQAAEVAYLDTSVENSVRRGASVSAPNPFVSLAAVLAGDDGAFAKRGSITPVRCDTKAVSIGDTLIISDVANGCAMADNSPANVRLIVGTAMTAKAAGSAGNVQVSIR